MYLWPKGEDGWEDPLGMDAECWLIFWPLLMTPCGPPEVAWWPPPLLPPTRGTSDIVWPLSWWNWLRSTRFISVIHVSLTSRAGACKTQTSWRPFKVSQKEKLRFNKCCCFQGKQERGVGSIIIFSPIAFLRTLKPEFKLASVAAFSTVHSFCEANFWHLYITYKRVFGYRRHSNVNLNHGSKQNVHKKVCSGRLIITIKTCVFIYRTTID